MTEPGKRDTFRYRKLDRQQVTEQIAMSKRYILVLFSALALAACSNDNNNGTPPFTGAFALINGVSDSGGLKADVGNIPTIGPISFGGASGVNIVPSGSYKVQLTPGASGSSTYTVNNVSIDHNNLTTVVSYGSLAGNTQNGLTAEVSLNAPTNGQAVVQPVHAAYQYSQSFSSLYFYFATPGGTITSTTPTLTVAFGAVTPSQSLALPAGKYEIRVYPNALCLSGVCPAIAPIASATFDSGPNGISLPASNGSNVFQFAALDATSAQDTQYGSQLSLVLLDNNGDSTQLFNGQN